MYVIAGVSGNTGSVVAARLLAAGKPVRVIVRDAAKGEAWRAKGAEVAVADLDDQAALARALTGATGAYLLVPPPTATPDGLAAERKAKIAALVGAVRAARPGHVVMLSSIGAELPAGNGPIKHLHAVEHALGDVGVPVTFLRAASFHENWAPMLAGAVAGGALYFGIAEGVAFPQVATADIGALAAELLLEGPGVTRIVELTGPAELSVQDVAGVLAKVSGKPVRGISVPRAAMVDAMAGQGAPAERAEEYGEMADAITHGTLRFLGTPRRGAVTLEQTFRALLGA